MTIGKEVYARELYTGLSTPSINEGVTSCHARGPNEININNDISNTNDVAIGTSDSFDDLNNFNNRNQLGPFDNSNPAYRARVAEADTVIAPNHLHKADELLGNLLSNDNNSLKSTLLENNASFKEPARLTAEPIRLSFQMMTRAEPVDMVIASIESLLAVKAIGDEILIVDNNNTETALYEPLAKYCAGLDAQLNVHFYHIDVVAGFKAGALNLALGLMDPRCTHVVVVDSDYQALPQARTSIAAAINTYPHHALLQFPQFYRDADREDVNSELNHYFNYHLYRLFNRQRALSTGTYAIIQRAALLNLGGWSGASITEDAQMGVLMHRQGLRSQFIPEVIATGLLPNTLGDLMSQRRRWIYGNMQVLNSYFTIHPLASSTLSATQSLAERLAYMRAHLSQLSAWVNFTGIFILLHICALLIIIGALLMDVAVNLPLLLVPLYVVYASYSLFLVRRLWAYSHDNAPLNQQMTNAGAPKFYQKLRTWLLHLSFWELGALSWLPVLWGRDKPFICTPKQIYSRTRRTVWVANLAALPKLLLVLNIITAVIVAPFSPLYSPLLFVCALTICVLKLWSAKVVFDNYAYVENGAVEASIPIDTAKSIIVFNSNSEPAQSSRLVLTKKLPTAIYKNKDKKVVNS